MSRSGYSSDHKGGRKPGKNARKKSNAKQTKGKQRTATTDGIRLNKYVANSGVCSRREADIYIAAGNVTVNGKTVITMGHKVKLEDEVRFDGRLLNPIKKEYVLLNKPKDFATVSSDDRGRRSAAQLVIKASKASLSPVGKMHKSSMGLLLFTNDQDFAKGLTHAKNGVKKLYHVELNRDLRSIDLKKIKETLTLEDGPVKVHEISYVDNASKKEVGVVIYSKKNNIVRRIFEHLDYEVIKLDRVTYAGLTKKDLPRGHWRHLTEQEVINLGMLK